MGFICNCIFLQFTLWNMLCITDLLFVFFNTDWANIYQRHFIWSCFISFQYLPQPKSSCLINFNSGILTLLNSIPVLCNIWSALINLCTRKKVKLLQFFINYNIFVGIISYFNIVGCHFFFVVSFFLRVFLSLLQRITKWCNQKKLLLLMTSLKGKLYDRLFLAAYFYWLKIKFCMI